MFGKCNPPTPWVHAGPAWPGLHQYFCFSTGGMYGKQAEPQQPAQRPGAPVLVPSAARGPHGQPHLVRGGGAVRPLQHQFEREAKLHLQDHKDIAAAGTGLDCNDIAPGDLTFGLVSAGL